MKVHSLFHSIIHNKESQHTTTSSTQYSTVQYKLQPVSFPFPYHFIEILHFFIGRSKGRRNDDISLLKGLDIFLALAADQIDLHIHESVIDFGIVNVLIGNVQLAIGIMFDGFAGQGKAIDRSTPQQNQKPCGVIVAVGEGTAGRII
jgi:hypothetical protein